VVLGEGGVFTVHSAYLFLGAVHESIFNDHELRVFNNIWKSLAPSKVIAFSWKLLWNRIPARSNLALRGIQAVGDVTGCVHCIDREENDSHLFLFCDFASQVWNAIFQWLDLVIVLPPNLFLLFDCLTGAAANRKIRKGFALIWHTTVWSSGGFGDRETRFCLRMVLKITMRWWTILRGCLGDGG
jgi:hypothetical protein